MNSKQELRAIAKKELKNFDKLKSAYFVEKIRNTEEYRAANNVLLFYPTPNEINLLGLLKDETKNFYLPKIDGENLLCCPYKDGDETCLSCFKTCEPLTKACDKTLIDLAIVPALACDVKNFRLGYGGGFYDRFLKDFKGKTISCVLKNLVFKTVYPEKHDIPVDVVIS